MALSLLILSLLLSTNGSFSEVVDLNLHQIFQRECNASEPVRWLADPNIVQPYREIVTMSFNNRAKIEFLNVSHHNVGHYYCVPQSELQRSKQTIYQSLYVFVKNAIAPFVAINTNNLTINNGDNILVPCKPTSKDVKLVLLNGQKERIKAKFNPQFGFTIKIPTPTFAYNFSLECVASGFNDHSLHFNVHHSKAHTEADTTIRLQKSTVVGALMFCLITICLSTVGLTIIWRKMLKYKKDNMLRTDQWTQFIQACSAHKDPVSVCNDEPAVRLKRIEFPQENLHLGEQLGNGGFGVVYRATARNILPDEPETVVAVKMMKNVANLRNLQALQVELSIMKKLGRHLNVVNMLGAVTDNIVMTGQMMIIMEYCRFGNLKDYIIKYHDRFVDQITSNHGIDSNLTFRDDDCVAVRMPPDDSERSITTTDLVCWAFQVARGMSFLTLSKIVHGDLALRNLLLCDQNVVKIGDFGLAKELQETDFFYKNEESAVPVKWLALETIEVGIFSIETDIWAFGVVMWEIFSLAKAPYKGVPANREFFNLLKGGYRLEWPQYATKYLYDLMLSCWRVAPDTRPSFEQLTKALEEMLPNEVKMDLVQTYQVNEERNSRMVLDSEYMDLYTVMKNRRSALKSRLAQTIYIDDESPKTIAPIPPREN